MKNLHRSRRNILTREQAHDLLYVLYEDIVKTCQEGLNQFSALPPSLRLRLRPRTLAGTLNDCICHDAQQRFGDMQGVAVWDEYNGLFVIVNGRAALRFKKVDKNLAPKNYPTPRQVNAAWQQLELPGVEIPTVVNVGYETDLLFTEIKTVSISCRRGRRLLWEIPLAGDLHAYLFDHEGNAKKPSSPAVRSTRRGEAASG